MIRRLLLALAVLATLLTLPHASAAVTTQRITGDLTMSDGVTLRYTVVRPAGNAKLPTLFEYSGYDPGTNPDASYIRQYVESGAGYNYIGVSIRGTGCSTGTFDFFQPAEAKDGAAVIAWIRKQPWSNGKVGMIGKSYPGITQLFVAAENPPGLLAIAPGHFFADAYRDVARPGGIQNYGFASLWSFIAQPSYGFQSNPRSCPQRSAVPITNLPTNPFVQLQSHLYDDELLRERSPKFTRIKAAVLATESWQDEQLASRGTDLLAQYDDLGKRNWWLNVTNGDHGMMRTATGNADPRAYYDYTLKGIDRGWSTRPRVKVWWDSTVAGRKPTWVTGMQHWSEKQRVRGGTLKPLALSLRGDGTLSRVAPVADPSRTYAYVPVAGSQGIGNPAYGGVAGPPDVYLWSLKPPPRRLVPSGPRLETRPQPYGAGPLVACVLMDRRRLTRIASGEGRQVRQLAGTRRAGTYPRRKARLAQRQFVRKNWWQLTLLVLGVHAALVPAVLINHSDLVRGFMVGSAFTGSLAGVAILTLVSTGTGPTIAGQWAEEWTAEELAPLQEHGYRFVNHVLLKDNWDADHVLVGPSGCYVLDSKWSASSWKQEGPQLRKTSHAIAKQADQVRRLLGGRSVEPLIVLWGEARTAVNATGVGKQDGVRVIAGDHLQRWMLARPSGALSAEQVETLYRRTSEIALAGDEKELPTPRSVEEMFNASLLVAAAALAGLLVPLYAGGINPTLTLIVGAIFVGVGVFVRRRRPVVGTALITSAGASVALWAAAELIDHV